MRELGATGLAYTGGEIQEEWLRQLSGPRRLRAFREMVDNDDIIGATFYAIEMLLRGVEWTAEPADPGSKDTEQTAYAESLLADMSHTWGDFLTEWMACPAFGFAPFEIILKTRRGDQRQPGMASKHNDGLWGVRKLAIRHPDTITRWLIDEAGGIQGLEQVAPPTYKPVSIPIEKLLLFRVRARKGNPEGTPLLRNAYVSYIRKRRIAEVEAIGIERNYAGLPVMYTPAHWHIDGASTADQALLSEAKRIVRNLRLDEQAGVVLPSIIDPDNGERLLKLELLAVGGGASVKNVDMSPVVERYDRRIAMTILADVIMLGHEKVGSFALASSKTNLFAAGLGALLDGIEDTLNRHLLPRLWRLNGWDVADMPRLRHGDIENTPLDEVAALIETLAAAGAPIFPDDELENHLRRMANLPPVPDGREARAAADRQAELDALALGQQADAEFKAEQARAATPAVKKYDPNQPRESSGTPEGGQWTDGGGSTGRAVRARQTHKPSTAEKQRLALAEQRELAKALGGEETGDNHPVDVLLHRDAIEVKTVVDNNNDKITVHPASRRRKLGFARRNNYRLHTVAIDRRGSRRVYYYRRGVGAFRLGAMEKVTLAELRERMGR